MFVCSECGNKYEEMPKFCDCGNDIFEQESSELDLEENLEELTDNKYFRNKPQALSPFALAGFVLCIIFSIIILFFLGNPKTTKESEQMTNPSESAQEEIPSIDSFWDNTTRIVKLEPPVNLPAEEKTINEILPKFVQNIVPVKENKNNTKLITQNTAKSSSKTQTKKTQTTVQTPQSVQTKSKTSHNATKTDIQAKDVTNRVKNNLKYNNTNLPSQNAPAKQNVNSAQSYPNSVKTEPIIQPTPITQPVGISQSTQIITNSQTIIPKESNTQTQTKAPIAQTKPKTDLAKELSLYKSGLRNTIGRKIDFTKVIGDGECILSFKINSSGKLISKSFIKQSSNLTLNDAVYTAMNSVTSYNPPPEGYMGETITLKIKFYNGNFEITLN